MAQHSTLIIIVHTQNSGYIQTCTSTPTYVTPTCSSAADFSPSSRLSSAVSAAYARACPVSSETSASRPATAASSARTLAAATASCALSPASRSAADDPTSLARSASACLSAEASSSCRRSSRACFVLSRAPSS